MSEEKSQWSHLISIHGFADGRLVSGLAVHLGAGGVKDDGSAANAVKLGMVFDLRIGKVLDFRHGKLAHANKTRPGRDLVTEGRTDLGRGEGKLALVKLQQPLKVDENAWNDKLRLN